jgi:hypothetical protein
MNFTEINKNYTGGIPIGADLVILNRKDMESNNFDDALVLYGFDEMGMFDSEFSDPVYGFLK